MLGGLDREGAGVEGFLRIDRADRADIAARHVAQRIDARPLARQAFGQRMLEGRRQIAARQLDVAMRVALELVRRHEALDQRPCRPRCDTPSDTATMQRLWRSSVARTSSMKRGTENGALRHVDEMRAAVLVEPPGCGRGGQEAGMAAHDDADIDAGQRAEIEIDAEEGAGDELGRPR